MFSTLVSSRVIAHDEVAEWLRRWTANPLCSARVGSNPILVAPKGDFCPYFNAHNESLFLVSWEKDVIYSKKEPVK